MREKSTSSRPAKRKITDLPGVARRQAAFVRAVLQWYSHHGRSLPWRNTSDPYRILISEVMLQQTYVSRVLLKYPQFLRRFPSIRKLAAGPQRDVVIAWQGMGYNNRAVRLYHLAGTIVRDYGGRFPQTYPQLLALPGVGRYTANALLCSAFGKSVPVVDINIRRVFSRVFWLMKTTAALRSQGEIWDLAGQLIPPNDACRWNQALMDLGATVCIARSPHCTTCPIAGLCASKSSMKRKNAAAIRRRSAADAVPSRIYRGRIIETLRRHEERKNLRIGTLGRALHPRFGRARRQWLESLLTGLEKDGLIKRSKKGRWNERRVFLA